MARNIYGSTDEWRAVVIMSLVDQRRTTYELGTGLTVIAIGLICDRWFAYSSIIAAILILIGFVRARLTTDVDYDNLSKMWAERSMERDDDP